MNGSLGLYQDGEKLLAEPNPAAARAVERYFRNQLRSFPAIAKRLLAKVLPGL